MPRPTVEDLQAIWLFAYSRAALIEADEFLKEMETAKPESVQCRALIDAAVIAYGRPFTQCRVAQKRIVPLKDVSPPLHLAQFHQAAFDLRHTMVAHSDATPAQGYTATPNVVLVNINSGNFSLNAVIGGEMLPPMRIALRELCHYFVKHCEEKLKHLKRVYYSEVLKNPDGEYELVISERPAEWITPFHPKHGADFRV